MDVLVYNQVGMILRQVVCPPSLAAEQANDGEGWMLGRASDALNYIEVDQAGIPAINLRPTMAPTLSATTIQADGVDSVTLGNLPAPCLVIYAGPGFRLEGEVVEGEATFTTDAPGAHKITVQAWPYLDWKGVINAI